MGDGQLEEVDGTWRLRFTRVLPHSPETVWRALTEPEHLEAWFPATIEGERASGAALRFRHLDADLPPLEGEMLACEPPSLLEFSWGEDTLRFELEPHESGTELTLIDTLAERGKAARDGAGWHTCLDQLAHHLDGSSPPWTAPERWRQVHDAYVEGFGPEAAAIGPPEELADYQDAKSSR
jgi:uncharacterized protein YndB with AHSA1/START domain